MYVMKVSWEGLQQLFIQQIKSAAFAHILLLVKCY